jgi:protocatechuate 3,4-dioxygenase beta subunit
VAAPGDGTADAATVNVTMGAVIVPTTRDTAVISGTVKDSSGAAVANATVTVRLGTGGIGGTQARTDATGAYSVRAVNTNAATAVTVTATLKTRTGTATGTIAAPADGKTDLVTVNVTINGGGIQPTTRDTAVISGTVKDSSGAAVVNATVTVRLGTGGFGGTQARTDATGAYSVRAVNTNAATAVTVTATLNNRTGTATGTIAAPADGKTDLVTVNVTISSPVQPTRGDTLVISGTVKDSTGVALANAVVTLAFGGIGLGTMRDTTDASGNYSITAVNTNRSGTATVTSRVNNATGSVTATIAAPADGTTDHLTANIVIGQRLNPVLKTSAIAPIRGAQTVTGVYLLNGRQIDRAVLTNAKIAGPRAAIVRYREKAQMKLLLDR